MADTEFSRTEHSYSITAQAAVPVGSLWQLANGRAAAYQGRSAASINATGLAFTTTGKFVCPKTASIVLLDGGNAYWDHSANAITYRKNSDRDFWVGSIVGDAASADTECTVNLNVTPHYDYDLLSGPATSSAPIGTQALPGTSTAPGFFGYPLVMGGTHVLQLSSTNEAQRIDLRTVDSFNPVTANAIVEFAFQRRDSTGGGATDFNLGVASGTHATDFDSVAEYLAIHVDDDSNLLNLQSKDGTTTVAATSTTQSLSPTGDIALANVEEWWFDMRNPASVAVYRNGVRMLSGTTFNVSAAASNWFIICHMEKTASLGSPMVMALLRAQARTAEQ